MITSNFRWTIRGCSLVIAVIAIVLGGLNWLRAYERVMFIRREYDQKLVAYLQGRVLEVDLADLSQSWMEAECYLCLSEVGRRESIQSHVHRLEWLRGELTLEMTTQLHGDRGANLIELHELDVKLTQARSMLTLAQSQN